MPVYPKAGVSVVADSSDFDAAYKKILKEAGVLDSLAPSIKPSVDDTELKKAAGLVNDLNKDTSTKASVNKTDLDEALGILNDLKNLSVIDVTLQLTGASLNVLDALKNLPGIGQLLSNDNASAILSAGSGGTSPEELAIAQDLFANNMVESVEAGALLINQLKTLGVTGAAGLSEAANSAVNAQQAFLAVGQEADATQIILAQNQLVISGLAKDYSEASDIIASGLDQGLNTGDDFLDTITEYANNFGNAGASAQEFLSILNTGLESGFGNTDRVADLFRETTLRGLNPDETAAQDALKAAGLADETAAMQAGELAATTWFQTVIDTIKAESNAGTQQTLAADIFGTQAEDQTVLGALGINTIDAAFDTIEGRAATVATLLNKTIGNGFMELFNTINIEAGELLSSDAINLDQRLEDIKTAIQTTVDEIQSGSGLGKAIEVGFKVEGVETALTNIERIFGNLIISLLEIVAFIQDPLGTGDEDAGTRAEISRRATAQLPFDLKVANADEFQALIDTAVKRGVSQENLSEGVRTALDELTAEGNVGQVVDLVNEIIGSEGMTAENIQLFKDKYIAPLGTAFDEAIASGDFDVAKKIADAQGDTTAYTDALKGKFGFDAAAFDSLAADFAAGMDAAIAAENPTASEAWTALWDVPDATTTAVTALGTDIETAMTNANLATGLASDSMLATLAAMSDGFVSADEAVALADQGIANSITGNTMTASFDAMSVSAALNAEATKGSFQGVLATVSETDARMSAFFNGIMAKVGAVNSAIANIGTVPTGGGGTTNNTNIVVTNNTSTQSPAQADGLGYRFAAQIRGMT